MSWSVSFIGKAENVAKALKENSNKLSGLSKTEYDDALPHFIGLVEQNFQKTADSPLIQITAAGHGHDNYRQCTCSIQHLGGQLV